MCVCHSCMFTLSKMYSHINGHLARFQFGAVMKTVELILALLLGNLAASVLWAVRVRHCRPLALHPDLASWATEPLDSRAFFPRCCLMSSRGCFSIPVPVGLLMSQDIRVSWRGALLIETAGT